MLNYEQKENGVRGKILEFIWKYKLNGVKDEVLMLIGILENAKNIYEKTEIKEKIWNLLRRALSKKGYVVVEEYRNGSTYKFKMEHN